MNPLLIVSVFILLIHQARCHCPHMMGIKTEQPSGPSAPGKFPEGDQGWDYDESAAPGSVPKAHFIQSTYVYRSANELEKGFSKRVVNVLKEIRQRLAKTARLTIENENIECSSPTDHFRCQEFSTTGSWNYLIVEDEKNGAVVYTFDRKFNEKNDATIEMALLDAFSRHSPSSLIAFASPEAEKEVGYIRAMTNQELGELGKPSKRSLSVEKFGSIELNLVEPALLEVRTGSNLLQNSESSELVKFENSKEFDESLSNNQFVFVLFWNNNRMVSLHTFNLWLRVAGKSHFGKDVVLAHVACHENSEFCHGLNSVDFQTVVAYKNGINIGKTENIGDEEYYLNWIELMMNGALIKIEDEKQLSDLKKGIFAGKKRIAITIGLFPNENETSLKHLKIAAEKLAGKYYIAYFINGNSDPTISTYRSMEKQKRTDYNGKYDPATLMEFISQSSLPNVIDISNGFTTDLLLRQKRPILIQIGNVDQENTHVSKLSARQDIRKQYIFTKIIVSEHHKKVLSNLGVDKTPVIVVVNKDRVHYIPGEQARCPDHLLKIIQETANSEPNKVLSTKEAHPLRYLQVNKVNILFGKEDTIVLPDHTLFLDSDPFAKAHSELSIPSNGGTGGCPFMQGGADPTHDEL